jgi:putative MFS transporter
MAPAGRLSLLLASVYIGAAVGAPLLGWWADRHGRRSTLTGILLWLAITSLGAAAADDVTGLTLFRGLSGVALGAYPPLVIAYLTDLLPPQRRGMLIFVAVAFASLGAPAGVLLLRWLTPLQPLGIEAWRWAFVAGGVGAAIVGILFRALPESPRWFVARGRDADAFAVYRAFDRSTRVLHSPSPDEPAPLDTAELSNAEPPVRVLRRWSLVGGLFLLSPWATVAFPLLTGAVLTQKGFQLSDALLYVALSMFGPLIGTLLAAVTIDGIERRKALACGAVAMVASGACFVASASPAWLVASSIVFGVFAFLLRDDAEPVRGGVVPDALPRGIDRRRMGAQPDRGRDRAAAAAAAARAPRCRSMFAVIAATLACSAALLLAAPPGRQRKTVG